MEAWIFVHDPLERYLDDYHSIFDAWEAGGVRGIAVGYLRFSGDMGESVPTFRSDPAVYEAFGVEPPEEGPRDPVKEQKFQAMLDDHPPSSLRTLLPTPTPGPRTGLALDVYRRWHRS